MLNIIKAPVKKVLKALHLRVVYDYRPYTCDEIDEEFNSLYDHAQKMTQMTASDNILRRRRHHTLMQLFKNVITDVDKGNIAECGCFRGLSSYEISHHAAKNGFKIRFVIFDSFEGLSEFKGEDLGRVSKEERELLTKALACPLDIVQENLKEFKFIDYKKGWIPERFSEASDMKFIFVHIDVDLYQPIKDSLEFLYPRTLPGGIIAFDDYGCMTFPGAKRAVDEFMKEKKDFFISVPSGEAFIVKK